MGRKKSNEVTKYYCVIESGIIPVQVKEHGFEIVYLESANVTYYHVYTMDILNAIQEFEYINFAQIIVNANHRLSNETLTYILGRLERKCVYRSYQKIPKR